MPEDVVPAKEQKTNDGWYKVFRDSEGHEYFTMPEETELHRVSDGGPGLYLESRGNTSLYKKSGQFYTPVVRFPEGLYMVVRKTVPPIVTNVIQL